jgi:hypothetical protein
MTGLSRRSSKNRRAARPRIVALPTRGTRATTSVRWSRVATARARIAAGYYDRLEVQHHVADALIDELSRS